MLIRLMVALVAATALAGCAEDKQWMKVGQSYTTTEFRRDYAECSKAKGGKLDEDCMRTRGWVDVKPSKAERAAETPPPTYQDPRQQRR